MLTLKKVAITGGLACGKTTVCGLLSNLGAYVVSADSVVHQLLANDAAVAKEIVNLLGVEVISDHQLDRTKIANAVFSHPELLQSLENLLHPAVKRAIEAHYTQACAKGVYPFFAVEVPLLFESAAPLREWFDLVVCIVADKDICRLRWGKGDFEDRWRRQWPLSVKAANADIAIDNSGTLESLRPSVEELFHQITAK